MAAESVEAESFDCVRSALPCLLRAMARIGGGKALAESRQGSHIPIHRVRARHAGVLSTHVDG